MNLQDKTAHIQEAAMTEARLQGNAIIEQHRKALEGVFEQHKAEVFRQSETRVKAETTSVKQQLNMATSKAQLELKRELGKVQRELKTELFQEVNQLVQDYMKTEEYKSLLVNYIEKAAKYADGAVMTIYINPTDADKKEYLEEHTGMTLTVSREDFIGGIRAVIREKNILIDHAFKGAIEREYQKFLFKGGTGIG
ncbi:MAG: V-type ATP synthase subunit E [Dorea sp.]